jgi:hypothetical protein
MKHLLLESTLFTPSERTNPSALTEFAAVPRSPGSPKGVTTEEEAKLELAFEVAEKIPALFTA